MLAHYSYGSITYMIREPTATTFLLTRHALTVWNAEQRYAGHTEVALAPEAELQIRHLTHKLVLEPIGAIYSSPLSRCLLTVSPLAEILGIDIGVDRRLLERDLGAWEGRPASELELEFPGFHFPESAYSGQFVISGSESLDSVAQRTHAVLEEIAVRHPGTTVLIATHAGIIWAAENMLCQQRMVKRPWPENSTEVRLVWNKGELITA